MSVLAHDRPYVRSVGDEPLPGYRLVAPLGQGGFGEVWKCVAPGGLHKAIKFVFEEPDTPDDSSLRQEYEAFLRVKGIRHPFLLTLERVELILDELIMVMELADESLAERFQICRNEGKCGIDQRVLLAYMVDIAEALDVLSGQHGLQHLDIKPANLFLMGGHVKVGDYGLVSRYRRDLEGNEPKLGRGLTPKYVAPEILLDQVDSRTDQYSLALVYFELLTGTFPFSGKSARQLLMQHASGVPDLRALPESHRPTVAKALSKSPADRFPTCLAFVKALLEDDTNSAGTMPITSAATRRTVPIPQNHTPIPMVTTTQSRSSVMSGNLSIAGTQRLGPGMTLRPPGSTSSAGIEELSLACPDLRYVGDGRASLRGRLVRAVDLAGDEKAVRIIRLDGGTAVELDDLYQKLAAPLPGSVQRVIVPQPRLLAVVWDATTPTLQDYLAGLSLEQTTRAQVVALLQPLAAILDSFHAATGFAHQLLSPTSILMSGNTISGVVEYGVGEAIRRSRAEVDWLSDYPYAAPESLAGKADLSCDQYSLALIYLELCRKWLPLSPKNRPGVPKIDWDSLPQEERQPLRRALSSHPHERFPTCADFLAALRPPARPGIVLDEVRLIEPVLRLLGKSSPPGHHVQPVEFASAVTNLAQAGTVRVSSFNSISQVLRQADGRYSLRFPVLLSSTLASLKLSAFTAQYEFRATVQRDGTILLKPRSSRTGLELTVQMPADGPVTVIEMIVYGRIVGIDQGPRAIEQLVTNLDQFRRAMQNADERRSSTRWRTELNVSFFPVDDELAVAAPIRGLTRDVSSTGFAAIVPGAIPTDHVFIAFDDSGPANGWAALARIVRSVPVAPHQQLIAGRFTFAGS